MEAVGLNRAESMFFHGHYLETAELPSGLGYEAVGTVAAVGAGVAASLVGTRVATIPGFSMNRYPVLAEQAVVPETVLAPVPAGYSRPPTPRPSGCSTAPPTARWCISPR